MQDKVLKHVIKQNKTTQQQQTNPKPTNQPTKQTNKNTPQNQKQKISKTAKGLGLSMRLRELLEPVVQ